MSPTSRPMAGSARGRSATAAPGAHQVTTRLVPRESRFVDQGDIHPGPGKHKSGDTARRSASDDEHVKAGHAHPAPPPSRIYSGIFSPMEERMPTETRGRNLFAQQLFSSLPKRYDQLAEVLSMGQNGRWRRAMVDHIAPTSPAPDTGRGIGDRWRCLATRNAHFVRCRRRGSDQEHACSGKRELAEAGMSERISLVVGRAEQLPFADGTFDALTFTYLLRYVDDPQATLVELAES